MASVNVPEGSGAPKGKTEDTRGQLSHAFSDGLMYSLCEIDSAVKGAHALLVEEADKTTSAEPETLTAAGYLLRQVSEQLMALWREIDAVPKLHEDSIHA